MALSGAIFCWTMLSTIVDRNMMNGNFIAEAIENTGVPARQLSATEVRNVVLSARQRLGIDITANTPWDSAEAPDGKLKHDGWELIAMYLGTDPAYVFTAGAGDIWRFNGGEDLLRVLRDCPPLEFYACNCEFSYLLCFNHHDYVIGWGAARSWVDSLES